MSAILLFAALASSSIAGASPERLLTERVSIVPGYGWDDRSQSPTFQKCVSGSVVEDQIISTSTISRRLQSTESLYRDLSISITAKAKAKFGIGSGGISASYKKFESTLSATNRINLSFSFIGEHNPQRLLPIPSDGESGTFRLTNTHSQLLVADPTAFRKSCGDSFIIAVKRRSLATVLYSAQISNLEDKQRIEKSLGASGTYGAVSVSGAISTISNSELKHLISSESIDFTSEGLKLQSGDSKKLGSPNTLEEVESFFDAIDSEHLSPSPYAVVVLPYTFLAECSANQQCKFEVKKEQVDPAAIYLERLEALQRERALSRLNSLPLSTSDSTEYLLSLHREITGARGTKMDESLDDEISRHANELKKALQGNSCSKQPCLRKELKDYDDLRFSLAIPVARNSVPSPLLARLQQSTDKNSRSLEYAILLWNNRVVQTSAARCLDNQECSSNGKGHLCAAFALAGASGTEKYCADKSVATEGDAIKAIVDENPDLRSVLSQLGYVVP